MSSISLPNLKICYIMWVATKLVGVAHFYILQEEIRR